MENASKALIIAGAILLAIVIISLGLIVVNNSRGAVDNANISEQEIQSFNAKFKAYEGDNVSGSRVNTLIQQVMSTNQAIADNGENNFVCIAFPSASLENAADGKKYIAYCNCNRTDNKYYAAAAPIFTDAATKRTQIMNGSGTATPSGTLAVTTGKTYKVVCQTDANSLLVVGILVTANS